MWPLNQGPWLCVSQHPRSFHILVINRSSSFIPLLGGTQGHTGAHRWAYKRQLISENAESNRLGEPILHHTWQLFRAPAGYLHHAWQGTCGVPAPHLTAVQGTCGVPAPHLTAVQGTCGVPAPHRTAVQGTCGVPAPLLTGHLRGTCTTPDTEMRN